MKRITTMTNEELDKVIEDVTNYKNNVSGMNRRLDELDDLLTKTDAQVRLYDVKVAKVKKNIGWLSDKL